MTSEERVILPDYIKPKIYHLSFEPDLEKFTFAGEQTVEYEWKRSTKQIKMNAKSLQVHSCSVTLKSGTVLNATNISYDSHDEYVIFDFDQEITESGVINVKWDGELNDKMVGFYRSEYKVGGESRYMATTQFEPTDARRAFPCWDEPAVKAQFAVTLIVPEDRVALSNMNIVSETPVPEKKKKVVKYAPTPIMSTYLLAFVVGEFDYIESHTTAGLPIRVYTQKGKTEQGKFGLDVAVRVIPLYEQYFGEKYPLPKLDLIAIPDFSAGAMENWGLVTYRETALLVDPVNSSTSSKQWVALVVCHECAHMWFGNLVTMEFWNGLWLNEGFATWVEYWAVDNLFPDWKIFEQFVHDDFGRAQQLDALVSSHPIEVDIKRAQEVDEIFDAISYSKGCAVIRMLVEWLGLETFRQGLLIYLSRHKFANATSDDLWRALGEAAKKDVKTMMTTWTRQTGYPVVTITEQSAQGSKRVLVVEQSRYLDSGKVEDNTLWQIPLSYITSANTTAPQTVMLTEKRQTIEIDGNVEWIKFNPNQTGFYRVMYPQSYYSKLVPAIENLSLPPIDRLGVLEDTCALAKSGYLSTDNALAILGSYKNEDNYTVWTTVSSNLGGIYSIIRQDPTISAHFRKYAVSIFKGIGQKLGWEKQENESHLQTLLRTLVISNLASYRDEETNNTAREKFEEYLKNPNSLVADLRTTVYASVIRNGGKKEYEQVLQIFRTSDLNEEKNRCLRALGATQDLDLLKQTFDFSFSKEVRSQDMFYVLMTAADNVKGIDMAWQFLQDNIQELSTKFEGGFIIGRVIKICIGGLVTEEKAKEVEQFFETHKIENAQRSIAQGVETIRLNASWLNRDKKVIAEWLQKHA